MAYRFNPFTGTFESGLTFPDLATPPANTALGSSGTPFSTFTVGPIESTLPALLRGYTGAANLITGDTANVLGIEAAGDNIAALYAVHIGDGIAAAIDDYAGTHGDHPQCLALSINANGVDADTLTAVYVYQPQMGGGSALVSHGLYIDTQAAGATNAYYSWFASRGTRRVKEDATFDGVGQAIEALYNPQFTQYLPGALDYERIVLGQWNSDVAEIGTENGGTGTLRTLRLIGNALNVVPAATFNSTITATDFIVSGSRFKSDTTNAHTGGLAVYDVDGAAYKDFLVWTNANAPAVVLSTPAGGTFSGDFSMLTIASVAVATQTYVNAQGFITTVGASSGTGNLVRVTAATLITPALGTPSALVLTNATGLPEGGLSLTDITTANVSATAHGFAPKFPNNTTTFLRGDGAYAAPTVAVNTDFLFTASQSITKTVNATSADGLLLTNPTAAAVGAQQWSPRLRFTGQGWKSDATTASQTVDWIIENQPIQATTNPTSNLVFSSQVNAAGYTTRVTFTSGGAIQLPNGSVSAPTIQWPTGGTYLYSTSNGLLAAYGGSAYVNIGASGNGLIIGQAATFGISFVSASPDTNNPDTTLSRPSAAATLQMGINRNGPPTTQNFGAHKGITGTDIAGAVMNFFAGPGTGAATGSSITLQTPTALTTGTTAQSLATRLTINSSGLNATVPIAFGGNLAISNAVPTISSGFGSGATIAGIAGGFRITCGTAPGVGGTVAFNATYANAPVCFVQDETTGILGIAAPTTTTVVISGLTLLSGQTVAVFVFGY